MISKHNNRAILTANLKGVYEKDSKKFMANKAESLNELSWQNKILVFDDTKLTQVLSDVENHFGVVLNLKDLMILFMN